MPRKPINPIFRAVTDCLLERDRLEMRAINTLLSVVEPKRRRSKRPRRQKRTERSR